jgi:hypothetical protein
VKFITDLLTERDGISWCVGRVVGFAGACVMCYKFVLAGTADFANFAGGLAAIIAAIGFKNISERP